MKGGAGSSTDKPAKKDKSKTKSKGKAKKEKKEKKSKSAKEKKDKKVWQGLSQAQIQKGLSQHFSAGVGCFSEVGSRKAVQQINGAGVM